MVDYAAVDGGAVNLLAHLKVSRGRNLRKDAGDIKESNLDRSSKPNLERSTELLSDRESDFLLYSEQFYRSLGI